MGREGEPAVTVVLAGGIFSDSYISSLVEVRLAETLRKASIQKPSIEPAEAAARLAAHLSSF